MNWRFGWGWATRLGVAVLSDGVEDLINLFFHHGVSHEV